jgi:hypothetical protein
VSVLDPWFEPALFWRYGGAIALCTLSLWLPMWAIRHRNQLDLPMDQASRLVRWAVVLVSWVLASTPIKPTMVTGFIRLPLAATTIAFHNWPNLSVYVVRRWLKRGERRDAGKAA